MDKKLVRVIVGLALECALIYGFDTMKLDSLYLKPDLEAIRRLYDKLISSHNHHDREVAIWLEPAVEQAPLQFDSQKLAAELREMEFVLFSLINQDSRVPREMNNWMNYIANAAQFLLDGFWIDAKVLLSRALQSSKSTSIKELDSIPRLSYELEILKKATESYFEEIKKYPLSLKIAEERLDVILSIQNCMLSLMKNCYRQNLGEGTKTVHESIHSLSSALRYLIEEKTLEKAKRDLNQASSKLGQIKDVNLDKNTLEKVNLQKQSIEKLLAKL